MPKYSDTRQVKIFLSPTDHDRLRVAAAMQRTGMSDFCRGVVLEEAGRVAGHVALPDTCRHGAKKAR